MTHARPPRFVRHRQGGFIFLFIPWWVNLALAVLAYGALAYGLPALAGESQIMFSLARGLRPLAPYLFILFLGFAIVRFVLDVRARQLASRNALVPVRFEEMLDRLSTGLRAQGFEVRYPAPSTGADLILVNQAGEVSVGICRYWLSDVVDAPQIRELFGVVTDMGVQAGIFFCLGGYTQAAGDFAHQKPLFLVGGNELRSLLS